MFKTVKKLVKGSVTVAGEVVKAGTKVASTVTTEAIAIPTELYLGRNAFSDGLRDVNRGIKKATDVAIDRVGKPVVTRVLNAPFTKAEHVVDLVGGAVQATFGDREKGLRRLAPAAGTLGLSVLLLGLVDEEDWDAIRDFLGIGTEALPEGAVAAAGIPDAAGALAEAGAPAGAALTSASAVADMHAPVMRHAARPVRFGGESHLAAVLRLSPADRDEWLQDLIDRLPANVPRDIAEHLRLFKNGATSLGNTALAGAGRFVELGITAARIRFSGGG